MQFEDDATYINLFWTYLNLVVMENEVPNVNFEGFMLYSAQANWAVVKNIYKQGDPNLLVVGCEHTCFYFHSFASLENVTQKYIKASLQF